MSVAGVQGVVESLIGSDDPPPFTIINPEGRSNVLLVCDHASNTIPVALGQLGFALGGAIAGPLYAGVGYASNTIVAAASILAMGLIVWFFVPEPERKTA